MAENEGFQVMLSKDQEASLKKYFYQIALDTLQDAKKDLALDRDLLNQTQICEWLGCSYQTLKEFISKGLPVYVLSEKKFYFSKREVREWIINFNKN